MNEQFYPYQLEGAEWLKTRRFALLADEMGLGKSAQAIKAADLIEAKRILVICPAIARVNWIREFEKFSEIKRDFKIIFNRDQIRLSQHSVIISYDLAIHYKPDHFGDFDLLVLDESHYLKSIETKRAQKVLGKNGYIKKALKTWCLSGTPMPNNASELWPWFYTTGVIRSDYENFVAKYCTTVETGFGRQITGTKFTEIPHLKALLKPHMLRRKTSDVLPQLPQISFSNIYMEPGLVDMELPPNWGAQYFTLGNREDELLEKLDIERKLIEDNLKVAGLNADSMKILEGLATSVSTIRQYIGLQKVAPTIEMVKDELKVGAYDKIVIFAIHQAVIKQLREGLNEFGAVTLYGGTAPDTRQKNIDRFQTNKKCQVFIGQIQAAGSAITLTAANQVLFVEQSWVPGDNAQAAKRCHRIGQKKPVFVRFATIPDTFDERISHVLRRKSAEIAALFEKNILPQIPTTDIFQKINE